MVLLWWLLTLSLLAKSVRTFPTNALFVSEDAVQCNDKGSILFCDYKNNPQDPVYTKSLRSEAIEQVFIYNANELHINDNFCANVAMHNVGKATVNQTNECNTKHTLTAEKTKFDYIHSNVKKLHLEECIVGTIVTDTALTKLNIIQSEINVLNATGPVTSGAAAIIQNSRVTTLEKLIVDSGSSLVIEKSEIDNIQPEGLEIINSSVTVKDTFIGKFTESTLTVENFQGGMTISRAMHKTRSHQQNASECKTSNIYSILFYISLALLILSWVGFLVFIKNNVTKQKQRLFLSPKKTRGQEGEYIEEERQPLDSKEDMNIKDINIKHENKQGQTLDIKEADRIKGILEELQQMLVNFTRPKSEPREDSSALEDSKRESDIPMMSPGEYLFKTTEKLQHQLDSLDIRVSDLRNISGQEGRVLELSRGIKNLKACNFHPNIKEFYEGINIILDSPVSDTLTITEAFTKWNEKFTEIVQLMGSPTKKSNLSAKVKDMEKEDNPNKEKKPNNKLRNLKINFPFTSKEDKSGSNKNDDDPDSKVELGIDAVAGVDIDISQPCRQLGRPPERQNITETNETAANINKKTDMKKSKKQNKQESKERPNESQEYMNSYYILHANKFTSALTAIFDIEKQCLDEYRLLLNQKIHYVKKFVELLLQINIYYAKFFLGKSVTSLQ